jgi:hypothetical protein
MRSEAQVGSENYNGDRDRYSAGKKYDDNGPYSADRVMRSGMLIDEGSSPLRIINN